MTTVQLIDSVAKIGLGALISAVALTLARCLPTWHASSKAPTTAATLPHDGESKSNPELVRNLVSLWVAQNNVVWSRLTVIAALQTGVYAGWFTIFERDKYGLSLFIAVIGCGLSWAAYALIDSDLKWKYVFSEKLKVADPRLLPVDVDAIQGWKIMRGIILGFYLLNVALVAVSGMYLITYICWEFPHS